VSEVGDPVNTDELVAEIETSKITQEVRSPETGVIHELFSKVKEAVSIVLRYLYLYFSGDAKNGY
jgi:pyruvate/2-oxoglutarate dehydrogenase complex dihydrolipoamide acyltransferase (E2) component